jgi:hypothetical protein
MMFLPVDGYHQEANNVAGLAPKSPSATQLLEEEFLKTTIAGCAIQVFVQSQRNLRTSGSGPVSGQKALVRLGRGYLGHLDVENERRNDDCEDRVAKVDDTI